MGKGRMEAFSDGVLAIIITIMVLEIKVPHSDSPEVLISLLPAFLSYLLSFINVGIYWNNHHHLLHAAHRIDGKVLWANSHLLFWLSLLPFGSGWMGENHFAPWPTALFGFILFMAGVAYALLVKCLVALHGHDSAFGKAIGSDWKGKLSLLLYAIGIAVSLVNGWISLAMYAIVAIIWFIPDRRMERILKDNEA